MTEVTPSPENTSFSDFFDYNCFTNTALKTGAFLYEEKRKTGKKHKGAEETAEIGVQETTLRATGADAERRK